MRSKRRERYSRNLEGLNAIGFFNNSVVAPSVTAQANITSFLVNAVEGEIGFYEADGQTLITAPPADPNQLMYIVQKQDGDVKRTNPFHYDAVKKVIKTIYEAPVIQEDYIGYNPVSATGNLNVNIVGGLQEFVASVRETTPANQPFPIQEGRAIVRSGAPTDYDIAARIVEDMLNDGDFENNADLDFIRATVVSDLAGGVAAAGPTNVTVTEGLASVLGDADFTSPLVGQYVTIGGGLYKVTEVAGQYIILDRPYSGESATIAVALVLVYDQAAVDAALIGIRLRGYDETVHFDTAVSEDLADADIVTQVEWKQGSGAAWQVASLEDETSVFDGWTTLNEAWVEDFGKPTFFVDDASADEYEFYFLTLHNRILPSAGAPQNQTLMKQFIAICPVNGNNGGDPALGAAIDAIFPFFEQSN